MASKRTTDNTERAAEAPEAVTASVADMTLAELRAAQEAVMQRINEAGTAITPALARRFHELAGALSEIRVLHEILGITTD